MISTEPTSSDRIANAHRVLHLATAFLHHIGKTPRVVGEGVETVHRAYRSWAHTNGVVDTMNADMAWYTARDVLGF